MLDEDIEHELADCLWAIMIITHDLDIDLDEVFIKQMEKSEERVRTELEK